MPNTLIDNINDTAILMKRANKTIDILAFKEASSDSQENVQSPERRYQDRKNRSDSEQNTSYQNGAAGSADFETSNLSPGTSNFNHRLIDPVRARKKPLSLTKVWSKTSSDERAGHLCDSNSSLSSDEDLNNAKRREKKKKRSLMSGEHMLEKEDLENILPNLKYNIVSQPEFNSAEEIVCIERNVEENQNLDELKSSESVHKIEEFNFFDDEDERSAINPINRCVSVESVIEITYPKGGRSH